MCSNDLYRQHYRVRTGGQKQKVRAAPPLSSVRAYLSRPVSRWTLRRADRLSTTIACRRQDGNQLFQNKRRFAQWSSLRRGDRNCCSPAAWQAWQGGACDWRRGCCGKLAPGWSVQALRSPLQRGARAE